MGWFFVFFFFFGVFVLFLLFFRGWVLFYVWWVGCFSFPFPFLGFFGGKKGGEWVLVIETCLIFCAFNVLAL